MNINKLNTKVDTILSTITKLTVRIGNLENLTTLLNNRINEEANKRNDLSSDQNKFLSLNENELKKIKENSQQMQTEFSKSLNDIQTILSNDYNEKLIKLAYSFEEKYKELQPKNIVNKENTNDFSINEIKQKMYNLESEVNATLDNIREESTKNNSKMDFFEKKIKDDHEYLIQQISTITKQINIFENENNIFKNFSKEAKEKFQIINETFDDKENKIENLKNKIFSDIMTFQDKINDMYLTLNKEKESLNKNKGDIYRHLDVIESKNNSKIDQLTEFVNIQIKTHQNEIEHFESHVLGEQNNFNEFIQEKLNLFEENVNKNLNYSDDSMKQIKSNMNELVENEVNLRNKTVECINELNKHQTKKYESLLKILMNNNLVPIDFNYNNFCETVYRNALVGDIK